MGDSVLIWAFVILTLAVFSIAYGCLMTGDSPQDKEYEDKDRWDEAVRQLDEDRR
jgi:hypothetical protein